MHSFHFISPTITDTYTYPILQKKRLKHLKKNIYVENHGNKPECNPMSTSFLCVEQSKKKPRKQEGKQNNFQVKIAKVKKEKYNEQNDP